MMKVAPKPLPAMEESEFYRLLEEAGTVQIDISRLGRYFVPIVSFISNGDASPVHRGAIVRGHTDLLAAESVDGLLSWLRDLTDRVKTLQINPPDLS